MKAALLLPLLAACAGAAHADSRIATRLYQPSEIVTLHGRPGVESTIAFADDERIENVAVGNSEAWQVTPNKRANLLFVKPAGAGSRTNMTVVTDQHTYLFDLESGRNPPVYMLRFSYPPKPKPPPPPKPTPEQLAAAAAAATASATPPPPAAPDPATLDFGWSGKGDSRLLPARTFDDGHSVFLSWDAAVALPAILVREANGQEGPVNYTVRGGYVVVEGVPTQLILRAGKQMATLTADRLVPDGGKSSRSASADRSAQTVTPGRPYAHVADGRP